MGSEDLSKTPLDTVADHGLSHPAADGQPQAVPLRLSGGNEQRKPLRPGFPARGVDTVEITPVTQAVFRGESMTSSNRFQEKGRLRGRPGRLQTERRLRPLRRRRAMTVRPPRDRIRTRNPWVRFRFRLLG